MTNGLQVDQEFGRQAVHAFASDWTAKLQCLTTVAQDHDGEGENGVWRYTSIFSAPSDDHPVPIACVRVLFELKHVEDEAGHLFNLQFALESSSSVYQNFGFHPSSSSIKPNPKAISWEDDNEAPNVNYEVLIDRMHALKQMVRRPDLMMTEWGSTRLAPMEDEDDEEEEFDSEAGDAPVEAAFDRPEDKMRVTKSGQRRMSFVAEELVPALAAAGLPADPSLTLSKVFANVFEAADESCDGRLKHSEVMALLDATLTNLGLEEWDIKQLMTRAPEAEDGMINWKPFQQDLPEQAETVRHRRKCYEARHGETPQKEILIDHAEACFKEELETTAELFFEQARLKFDPNDDGIITRGQFREILTEMHHRFTPQEAAMMMQVVQADEFGYINYKTIYEDHLQLRIDAINNAMVETDVEALRKHLVFKIRNAGMKLVDDQPVLAPQSLKNILLSAELLCLNRMQVHVLLCVVQPDHFGNVDARAFLDSVCNILPFLFDCNNFVAVAESIIAKIEQESKEQDNAGWAASQATIPAAGRPHGDDSDDDEGAAAKEELKLDKDQVIKQFMQMFKQQDTKSQQFNMDIEQFNSIGQSMDISSVQFNHHEMTGFIAEARVDELNEVNYEEHAKTWVPITYELRNSKLYSPLITPPPQDKTIFQQLTEFFTVEWQMQALDKYEEKLSLMPPEMIAQCSGQSQSRRAERRKSLDKLRGSQAGSRSERRSSDAKEKSSRRGSAGRGSIGNMGSIGSREDSRRGSSKGNRGTGKKSMDSRATRIRLKDQPKGQRRMQCILERTAVREVAEHLKEEQEEARLAAKAAKSGSPKGNKSPKAKAEA